MNDAGGDAAKGVKRALAAMSPYKSDLLRLLDERGYIHQVTDAEGLDALAQRAGRPRLYRLRRTAPSLHVGSLVQIMMLRRLQQAGHKPIVLMGGGTTKIGDPSGKDESRKLLTDEQIAGQHRLDPQRVRALPDASATARPTRSWSTTPTGSTSSTTSRSCATSARISRSTAC